MRYSDYFKGRTDLSQSWRSETRFDIGTDSLDGGWSGTWSSSWSSDWRDLYQKWDHDWLDRWEDIGWIWRGWKKWCWPGSNTAPDAVDDTVAIFDPATPVTGNLLANDSDDDGDTLTVTRINGKAFQVGVPVVLPQGVIEVQSDGSYSVQGDTDFSFTYTISDGRRHDTATVHVSQADPVYFTAQRDGRREFWKTDGTPEGTEPVLDLTETGTTGISEPTPFNGGFVFEGFSADGSEPWFTDGTPEGTFQLANLTQDLFSSQPEQFTVLGDRVIFKSFGDDIGQELFVTDGTSDGTGLLMDIRLGLDNSGISSFPVVVGGYAYFAANDGSSGRELWRTDGTVDGTGLVKNLNPGPDGSDPAPLFELDGKVVVRANRSDGTYELWLTDGTGDATVLFADKAADAGPGPDGDALFFRQDIDGNFDLWRSDGTAGGTAMVADLDTNGTGGHFTQLGDSFVFAANYRESGGFELWKTDGTEDGTELVQAINATGDDAFGPAVYEPHFSSVGGGLIFRVNDGVHGREPWFTDGTADGTDLIADLDPDGSSLQSTNGFTYLDGGKVVFRADTPDTGLELWVSDGTADGTYLLADIEPGEIGSSPGDFIA